MNKWQHKFFCHAEEAAKGSKDRTKIGAAIMRPNKSVASLGFNGLPPNIDDDKWLSNRDIKNMIILHAEENAIGYCADFSLEGYHIFTFGGLTPCGHCASIIIREGISEVHCVKSAYGDDIWNQSTNIAKEILSEAKVKLNVYSIQEFLEYR